MALIFSLLGLAGCAHPREGYGSDSTAAIPSGMVHRGRLISATLIERKTAAEVGHEIQGTASAGVAVYKIIYETITPIGEGTTASGSLVVPEGISRPLPLMSYQHGTVARKENVPSREGLEPVNLSFGGTGYVVASPDYLGLGDSPGFHPYVHAASLATAVVDMLRASRSFCAGHSVALNGQIFLLGYSEGGYATMAAHKAIEEGYSREFSIAASAPMAGPYDMSGTMRRLFLSGDPYPDPFYMPYVILAYNSVYHLTDSLSKIFVSPYAGKLPGLFDGGHGGGEINQELPSVPGKMLRPGLFAALGNDPNSLLAKVLTENDLYRWTPVAPMRIYHCRGDDRVPYANADVAYRSFIKRGATHVELITLDNGGHGECFLPCIVAGKEWFDSICSGHRPEQK